jgi:hypothetical protein
MLTDLYQEALSFLQARLEERRLRPKEEHEQPGYTVATVGWSEETYAQSRNLARQARTTMAAVAAFVGNSP